MAHAWTDLKAETALWAESLCLSYEERNAITAPGILLQIEVAEQVAMLLDAGFWRLYHQTQTYFAQMRFALLLLAILVTGCATTQSLSVYDRSRTYEASFDVVFDAVVMALTEDGFAVTDARKEEGIINTDFRTGNTFGAFLRGGPTRTKVNALVSSTNAGTRVVLNIALEDANIEDRDLYATRNMTERAARRFYNGLFAHIEAIM